MSSAAPLAGDFNQRCGVEVGQLEIGFPVHAAFPRGGEAKEHTKNEGVNGGYWPVLTPSGLV